MDGLSNSLNLTNHDFYLRLVDEKNKVNNSVLAGRSFSLARSLWLFSLSTACHAGYGFTGSFDATWSELSWPGSPQKERTQRFAYKSGIPLQRKRRRCLRLWVVEQEYKLRLNSFKILGKLVNVNLSCCTELPRPFQVSALKINQRRQFVVNVRCIIAKQT